MIAYLAKVLNFIKILKISKRPLNDVFQGGYSVASTSLLKNISKHCPSISTILDVGANQGQFALAATWMYPLAQVYSFEPLPDIYISLCKNTNRKSLINTFNTALGTTEGSISFYKNDYSHASSALPISFFQVSELPETAITNEIIVPVTTLDTVAKSLNLVKPVLLKLDVQGYEMHVLEGAKETLEHIDYLVFEASFTAMYEGEFLFNKMHDYVQSKGFEIVSPVGSFQNNDGQFLQLDILYKRV
ncbi:FkbM family methyltransferase [Fibrella sp. ES10-3-2-2]|nr:hypothetical protein A6C57_05925 [Fibrella sp. ES10-3-2-2]